MGDDWQAIAVRFGLYLDLMLLFGVPLFGLYAFRRHERALFARRPLGGLLAATGIFGVALSVLGMAVMAKSMSGAEDYASVERHVYEMVVMQTDVGISWLVRMGALALAICAAVFLGRWPTFRLSAIAVPGAVALASLAWTGHGAMDDGAKGLLHLSADILHLLAGAAWVGALVMFVLLSVRASFAAADRAELLSRMLGAFANIGTVIVVTLVITGASNYWLISEGALRALVSTDYGVLMLVKLSLFVLMLGLAAAHRYLLSPRLVGALRHGSASEALAALRRSLAVEFTAATGILMLVAWLGTLSPSVASG
ncbi:putative copper resistance protein D [Variovorax sp. HW608]|uniref:copper homeostasis membrane protein CopD n=1 Tax=Variovorax sp. HW608 TaxID=1034889 RepID=UPI00081FC78C|nr:copper homeostasis membrane protein CopD [Variovorax sp. HW608]SCK20457.1 putative copper resistance protein D [Variovorax sp. HW608]